MHGVHLDAREAALLEQHGGGDHLVDLLANLVTGQGRGGDGGVVIVGNFRGTEAAHGVAAVAHGHLGEHPGPVGVQPLQQLDGGALEGLGGLQRLLAVQRVNRVHQGVRVEGPGVNEAEATLGPRLKVGQPVGGELPEGAVEGGQGEGPGAEPVLDGQPADLQGLEQGGIGIGHDVPPVFSFVGILLGSPSGGASYGGLTGSPDKTATRFPSRWRRFPGA